MTVASSSVPRNGSSCDPLNHMGLTYSWKTRVNFYGDVIIGVESQFLNLEAMCGPLIAVVKYLVFVVLQHPIVLQ